jgi:hypothetical protein
MASVRFQGSMKDQHQHYFILFGRSLVQILT